MASTTETTGSLSKAASAADHAKQKMRAEEEEERMNMKVGGLADNSVFARAMKDPQLEPNSKEKFARLAFRNMANVAAALNPRPKARARWQRRMVIRHVRKGGRLTREMQLARSERKHLSKSFFMKTSIKKMMMLSRQIAGKSIDEAILQMRFSKKKIAGQVLEHLVTARNEAVVMKGMGRGAKVDPQKTLPVGPMVQNPSTTVPEPFQTPTKTLKKGKHPSTTDIYIAESWVNRGKYGKKPEYRARGRMNILRPPHTGISVLLKEEKTRLREKEEKEARAIRRRLGKGAWNQLPDRPVTRQSQHVLW